MTEKLSKAWELFDSGNYTEAEKIYKECYASISSTDHDNYWQVLMGLIYVESFTKNFSEARAYASLLVSSSINQEEQHIALHQSGMVERMAEDYKKATDYFLQEENIIRNFFPNDTLTISANLYEQGYIAMKLHNLSLAEKTMLSALDFAEKSNDLISIGCAYRGLGEIMKAADNSKSATAYFQKAIDAFQKAGDPYDVTEVEEQMQQ